jgi:hypothetical protein
MMQILLLLAIIWLLFSAIPDLAREWKRLKRLGGDDD